MIGAVIIRAARNRGGEIEGAVISQDEKIGTSLGGTIRAASMKWSNFGEEKVGTI